MRGSPEFLHLKNVQRSQLIFYVLKWETHIFKYVYQMAAADVKKLYVNAGMIEGPAKS
jgi:hypothetical protein